MSETPKTTAAAPSATGPTQDKVLASLRELGEGSNEYKELVDLLSNPTKRKNIALILKEGTEALRELKKDVAVVRPTVEATRYALREGVGTSEFKNGSVVTRMLTFVAILAPVFEGALSFVQDDSIFGGNSVWVTGLAITLKALLAMDYSRDRTKIKTAAVSIGR